MGALSGAPIFHRGLFPGAHIRPCGIEDALIVALPDLHARSNRSEQELAVRISIEDFDHALLDLTRLRHVLGDLVPGYVEIQVAEPGIVQELLNDLLVGWTAIRMVSGRLVLGRARKSSSTRRM